MAAPKHNLYALGNNGGRPAKFETPEALEKKIIEYFQWCVDNKQELAISGISQFLGFADRQSMYDYEKKGDEYSFIIRRARQAVEYSYELDLRSFKFGGSIFALKNINKGEWKDKTEAEVNQTITNVAAAFGSAIQPTQESATDSQ